MGDLTSCCEDEVMHGLHMIRTARGDGAVRRPRKGGSGTTVVVLCLAAVVALALVLPQAHSHESDGHSTERCPTCALLLAAGSVAIVLLARLGERTRPTAKGTWNAVGSEALVQPPALTAIAPRAPPAISA